MTAPGEFRKARERAELRIVDLLREAEDVAPGWQVPSVVITYSGEIVGGTAHTKRVDPQAQALGSRWSFVNPKLCEILQDLEQEWERPLFQGTVPLQRGPDGKISSLRLSPGA